MTATPTQINVSDLSPFAQQVVKTKIIQGVSNYNAWMHSFRELASFDQVRDELYKKANFRFWLFLVLNFVMAFFILFLGVLFIFLAVIPLIALIVFVVLTVINYNKRKALQGVDLENDFRALVIPVLEELMEDVSDKDRMKVRLDLSGPTAAKVIYNQEVPPGRFRKVIMTVYRDPWCDLSIRLADGATLLLSIVTTYTVQERRWTNPRGKYKTKKKWKKLMVISASLLPAGEGLEWDPARVNENAATQKLKFKKKKETGLCRVVEKFKFKAVNKIPEQTANPQQVIGMFMRLFSMMKPAATESGA